MNEINNEIPILNPIWENNILILTDSEKYKFNRLDADKQSRLVRLSKYAKAKAIFKAIRTKNFHPIKRRKFRVAKATHKTYEEINHHLERVSVYIKANPPLEILCVNKSTIKLINDSKKLLNDSKKIKVKVETLSKKNTLFSKLCEEYQQEPSYEKDNINPHTTTEKNQKVLTECDSFYKNLFSQTKSENEIIESKTNPYTHRVRSSDIK